MTVIRIIPAGDLELVGGSPVLLGDTPESRVAYIRQKIAGRFKFFLGEWFLDKRLGIPYYRDVLGQRRPNLPLITSLFKRVLTKTPGVLVVASFSLNYDESARRLSFQFEATVTDGEISVTTEDADFVVGLANAA
jgi:hypothetical protein